MLRAGVVLHMVPAPPRASQKMHPEHAVPHQETRYGSARRQDNASVETWGGGGAARERERERVRMARSGAHRSFLPGRTGTQRVGRAEARTSFKEP